MDGFGREHNNDDLLADMASACFSEEERSSTDLVLWGFGKFSAISGCPSREARTAKEFETSTVIGTFSDDLWLFILLVGIKPSLESLSSLQVFLEPVSFLEVFSLWEFTTDDFEGWCLSLVSDCLEVFGLVPPEWLLEDGLDLISGALGVGASFWDTDSGALSEDVSP